MTVRTAVDVLVLIVLGIDLALTAGIIRRLRVTTEHPHAGPPPAKPPPGFQVDLTRDVSPWDDGAAGMVTGPALVAFVAPGCLGCERLSREVDEFGTVPVPFYVIIDPFMHQLPGGSEYLARWPAATARLVAPKALDALDSFDRPDEFPMLVLMRDGHVLASGHRLHDVAKHMVELSAASSHGTSS